MKGYNILNILHYKSTLITPMEKKNVQVGQFTLSGLRRSTERATDLRKEIIFRFRDTWQPSPLAISIGLDTSSDKTWNGHQKSFLDKGNSNFTVAYLGSSILFFLCFAMFCSLFMLPHGSDSRTQENCFSFCCSTQTYFLHHLVFGFPFFHDLILFAGFISSVLLFLFFFVFKGGKYSLPSYFHKQTRNCNKILRISNDLLRISKFNLVP